MRAVEWEIFDDLLIGNFMHDHAARPWPSSGLYPGFTPWVTKYADNGRARTDADLRAYFAEYRRRLGLIRLAAQRGRAARQGRGPGSARGRFARVPDAARQVYARVKGAT